MTGRTAQKRIDEKELARLILESKEFSKKYSEAKSYFEKIEEYLEELKKEIIKNPIPISVFKNNKLGILETAVKYLKEESGFSIKQIADLLNRKYTTIHSTYLKSKEKFPEKFPKKEGFEIEADIFSDRNVSPLHSIISFLKEKKKMRFTDIAKALDRDVRNISFTYHKYKKK